MPEQVTMWLDMKGSPHDTEAKARAADAAFVDATRASVLRDALPKRSPRGDWDNHTRDYEVMRGYNECLDAVTRELHQNRTKWIALLSESADRSHFGYSPELNEAMK